MVSDLEDVVADKKVWFLSFRVDAGQKDGVSLEVGQWVKVLKDSKAKIGLYCGKTSCPDYADYIVENSDCHFRGNRMQKLTKEIFGRGEILDEEIEEVSNIKDSIKEDLKKALEEYGVDYAVAENILCYPGNMAFSLAFLEVANELEIKVLAHSHDFYWERERFKVGEGSRLQGLLESIVYGVKGQRVAVINSLQKAVLNENGLGEVYVAPNVRDFDNPPIYRRSVDEYRRVLGLSTQDLIFLAPVRIIPRKNLELSLEFMRVIKDYAKERLGEVEVKMALSHPGYDEGGGYLERISALADEFGVELVILDCPLEDAYMVSDIVLYTTVLEGFGNALLEAMYHRKPVVIYPYEVYLKDIKPKGVRCIEVTQDGGSLNAAASEVMDLVVNKGFPQLLEENYRVGLRFFSHSFLNNLLAEALDFG